MKYIAAIVAIALSIAPGQAAVGKAPQVNLAAKGLTFGVSTLRFGAPRAKAIQIATAVLGAPTATGVYPECGGDHPIGYAKFRGGMELSFVGGKFVGWTLEYGGSRNYRMANGVGIGTTVAALQKLLPNVFIDPGNEEGGGIGPGFSLDGGPNGWVDSIRMTSKVTSMYSGDTCIVE